MMPAVLRIFLAELRAIAGHRQVALVLLVAPFIYALFYPQPYIAEALRDVPISVVDLDGSVASRDLVRQIDATPDVTVARTDLDFARATERVYSRDVSGVLVIPQFFERDLLHGRAAPVVLYADSSYFLVYQRLSTAVRSVVSVLRPRKSNFTSDAASAYFIEYCVTSIGDRGSRYSGTISISGLASSLISRRCTTRPPR